MNWAEKVRLAFLGRTRREKLLATAFVVVLALLWLVLLVARIRDFAPRLAAIRSEAQIQGSWLARRESIAARYEEAVANLRDRQLDGNEAYATVDRLLRQSGFSSFQIDPPRPDPREQLTFHPINVKINKANYFQLRDLFRQIMTALPNVNLEEVIIAAPDRSGQFVDAQFKFVAIEINE